MPDERDRELADIHVLRLILRDVIFFLLTETKIDGGNRQTFVEHLETLNELIGDDDFEKPD